MVDFDAVYNDLIRPAINDADLEPIRADEELTGGIIHKPMFERLLFCEYAVADLTTANANVFYELGVRHAALPYSAVLIFAERSGQLPFDVGLLRAIPYGLDSGGKPGNVDDDKKAVTDRLLKARDPSVDSPVYQLVDDYPDVDHTKTDVFRERVDYAVEVKRKLTKARNSGLEAVREVEAELKSLDDTEAGVLIDLFLSYRAVKEWDDMIRLAEAMPKPLAGTVMVQEQLGLALNRAGRGDEAEQVLLDLIRRRGESSETLGILGRVYKDRWEAAAKSDQEPLANALLDKAIDAYRRGFEVDWRDAYPGINAVTLMEIKNPPDPERERLIPVVRYAVERRIVAGEPDYWDYATLLELAVLAKDKAEASSALGNALALAREPWERETTARNLGLIREAREQRGESINWIKEIERALTK